MLYYTFEYSNGPVCTNSAGTCERALCECDREFAQAHAENVDVYNPDFSHIFAGFPAETICRKLSRDHFLTQYFLTVKFSTIFLAVKFNNKFF